VPWRRGSSLTLEQQVERCKVALPQQIVCSEQALACPLEQAGHLVVCLGEL
jgi:hypothetical protein